MFVQRKQGRIKTWLLNQKVIAALGLLVLVLIVIPLVKNIERRQKVDREISQLQTEISQVENQNSDLQKLIKYLQSDNFLEEQARLKLDMKKKNEGVAIISDRAPAGSNQANGASLEKNVFSIPNLAEASQEQNLSNPERWLKYFFKK